MNISLGCCEKSHIPYACNNMMVMGTYLQNQQKNFRILLLYRFPCFISKFITSLTSLSCNHLNRSPSSSLFIIFGFKIQNKMVAKLHFCGNNARKNVKLLVLNFTKPSYCYKQRRFTINLLSINLLSSMSKTHPRILPPLPYTTQAYILRHRPNSLRVADR